MWRWLTRVSRLSDDKLLSRYVEHISDDSFCGSRMSFVQISQRMSMSHLRQRLSTTWRLMPMYEAHYLKQHSICYFPSFSQNMLTWKTTWLVDVHTYARNSSQTGKAFNSIRFIWCKLDFFFTVKPFDKRKLRRSPFAFLI